MFLVACFKIQFTATNDTHHELMLTHAAVIHTLPVAVRSPISTVYINYVCTP